MIYDRLEFGFYFGKFLINSVQTIDDWPRAIAMQHTKRKNNPTKMESTPSINLDY